MEKNKNLILLIALIIIALLFKYSGFMGSLFAPEDDYAIYDDFSEGVFSLTNSEGIGTAIQSHWNDDYRFDYNMENSYYEVPPILPKIENEELKIVAWSCTEGCGEAGDYATTTTIKKDVKGIDFKFDLGFSGSSGYPFNPKYYIYLNDINVYSYGWGNIEASGAGAVLNRDIFTVETKSHLLDENLIDVYVKGKYVNTFNITDSEIYVKIKSSVSSYQSAYLYTYLDNLKFRVKFNCEIDSDEMLVTEIYNSGETIQMDNDQRISADGCKVESLCRRHPAFIITDEGSTQDEGDEIYESMVSGYSLTVPLGETWQLFFITKTTSSGRCVAYSREEFVPVEIKTVSSLTQTIYPGKFKTFETDPINILDMPSILQATFEIKAVGGGSEQIKKEIIVFKK